MLKYAVLLAVVFCSARSQRPWHAGTGGRLPQVLPQYLDEQAGMGQGAQTVPGAQVPLGAPPGTDVQGFPATTGNQGTQGFSQGANQGGVAGVATGAVDATIANRIDGDGLSSYPPINTVDTANTIPLDLPVDAHGDIDLINRIKTWPREKQPFWYINWQAIQAHRGDSPSGSNNVQQTQPQPNPTSFFAG